MSDRTLLSSPHVQAILAFLGCQPGQPSLRRLDLLIDAYTRRVPWESAFRIVKRHTEPDLCPRWPEEFWSDAIERGGGGTCFESNYAFLALLRSIGYEGYLTINDMGATRACHSALVVSLDGRRYLVDVGIPLHRAIPIAPDRASHRFGPLHRYSVRPAGPRRFEVERSRHPKRNVYTLLDSPVAQDAYEAAIAADYGEGGLFLDQVIITKVIEGRVWRFSSAERPFRIEAFGGAGKLELPLDERQPTAELAERFGMDRAAIEMALFCVGASRP